MLYTAAMAESFASRLLSSRLVRNTLAIAGTVVVTLIVFRAVAAFNDVLKIYNAMPVVSPTVYTCPKGYVLVKIGKTDKQECIPAPSTTEGVVPVGLYQPARQASPAPPPPAAKSPTPTAKPTASPPRQP